MGCGSSKAGDSDSANSDDHNGKKKSGKKGEPNGVIEVTEGQQNGDDNGAAKLNPERRASQLCGTAISLEYLHDTLKSVLQKDASEPSWIAERIGNGDVSDILRISFVWDNPSFPQTIVVKLPSKANKKSSDDDELSSDIKEAVERLLPYLHHRECVTYNWLTKHSVDCPIPHIYHTREHTADEMGVIVMEDFWERGIHPNLVSGINVEQLRVLLDGFAAVHATSLIQDDWQTSLATLARSRFEALSQQYPKVKEFVATVKDDSLKDFDKVERMFKTDYMRDAVNETCIKLQLDPVIVHGDPWADNFIFSAANPSSLLAVIDWQGAHPGCFGEDLAKLLVFNTDAALRREHSKALLEYYHQRLEQHYGTKCPVSLHDVRRAYNEMVPLAMVGYFLSLPSLAIDLNGDARDVLIERGKAALEDSLRPLENPEPSAPLFSSTIAAAARL